LSSSPNASPDFGLSVLDELISTFRVKLGLWSCQLLYQWFSWMLTLLTKWDPGHFSFQHQSPISRFQV
jgi:hypothetical protein